MLNECPGRGVLTARGRTIPPTQDPPAHQRWTTYQTDEHPGASSKQTALALLQLADTDVDSVTDTEFESRTAELEAVSSDLSREMAEYWSTNPELRIKVEIETETVANPNGQTSVVGYLNFRVEDRA